MLTQDNIYSIHIQRVIIPTPLTHTNSFTHHSYTYLSQYIQLGVALGVQVGCEVSRVPQQPVNILGHLLIDLYVYR